MQHPGGGLAAALAWLRRRGPPLPHGVLERLFRKRQVRVLADAPSQGTAEAPAPGKLRRIGRDAALSPGALLLIPKAVAISAPERQLQATGGHLCLLRAVRGGSPERAAAFADTWHLATMPRALCGCLHLKSCISGTGTGTGKVNAHFAPYHNAGRGPSP